MPDWITGWLDRLPAGLLAVVFCAFFVAITWLGHSARPSVDAAPAAS
jgi:hypothetical protein